VLENHRVGSDQVQELSSLGLISVGVAFAVHCESAFQGSSTTRIVFTTAREYTIRKRLPYLLDGGVEVLGLGEYK
jgi:hypothetical protein